MTSIYEAFHERPQETTGVTVWLDLPDDPLLDRILMDSRADGTVEEGWILGYGKLGSDWGLLTRKARDYRGLDEIKEDDCRRPITEPTWLQAASKVVRIEATEHFELLVKRIIERARKLTASA